MSVKKKMGIIITIGMLAMLAFGLFLYATIKTKSTPISQYAPFNQWVSKAVILDKETVLISEKVKLYPENGYPYLLLDSLHPDWPYIEERMQLGDYVLVERFPAGTGFQIEKAVQFTGGVSGRSTPFVFGQIRHHGKSYPTAYQWGTMDMAKFMDKVDASWHFHQAPWQPKADTAFYALPEARWW